MCRLTHIIQVTHGLSIPLGKLGYYLPRTISRSVTEDPAATGEGSRAPFHIGSRVNSIGLRLPTFTTATAASSRRNSRDTRSPAPSRADSVRPVWRIGGTVIGEHSRDDDVVDGDVGNGSGNVGTATPPTVAFDPTNRTIRFPDDDDVAAAPAPAAPAAAAPSAATAVAPASAATRE